jgi:hypothetical protein
MRYPFLLTLAAALSTILAPQVYAGQTSGSVVVNCDKPISVELCPIVAGAPPGVTPASGQPLPAGAGIMVFPSLSNPLTNALCVNGAVSEKAYVDYTVGANGCFTVQVDNKNNNLYAIIYATCCNGRTYKAASVLLSGNGGQFTISDITPIP